MIKPVIEYLLLRFHTLCPYPVGSYLAWTVVTLVAVFWLWSLWPKNIVPDTHGHNTRGEGQYDDD